MNDHTVQTTDLSRDFGEIRALDHLTLEVPKGMILTLLGPNGAGKTTLLRILMGLLEPTGGEARVLGAPARSQPADVAGRVAYVGDRCEPANWATLAMLEGLQADASRVFDSTLFRDCCKQREFPLRRPYGSLSKGQRRWVLTSLALACRPRLILLDEPADGLDPAARRALYNAIRDHVNQNDATVIVTTHVIADVERIADGVAIIDAGRLILHAPLEDLREHVRQVEIPASNSPPDLSDLASVLGCVQLGTTSIVWIKRNGLDDEEIRSRLGAGVTIRQVDLETLYLAIAERRPLAQPSDRMEVK
jgi:ABC-2 type transport system ATP-binding protein